MDRLRRVLPGVVFILLVCFYLSYPYRELIDDAQHRGILENKYFAIFEELVYSRPLHALLLYLHGRFLGAGMERVMFFTWLFHLLIGFLSWRMLIPRLPPAARGPALFGLAAFMVHPVSLQTVVHVSQRVEVLGTFFVVISFILYRGYRDREPGLRDFVLLGLAGLGALLSKESYSVVPFALLLSLAVRRKSKEGAGAAAILLLFMAAAVSLNPYSWGSVRNEDHYARSSAFREAVMEGREVADQDSIYLPLRSPVENVEIQTALVPLILRIVFLPFGLVKDYGHFPYGKATYSHSLPWLWLGAGLVLAGLYGLRRASRKFGWEDVVLIASPILHYAVYWVIVVYDPLFLYRLYGVVFLTFVVALPSLSAIHQRAGQDCRGDLGRPRAGRQGGPYASTPNARSGGWWMRLSPALFVISLLGGLARAYEMRDPIGETAVDLARRPDNFRLYVSHMRKSVLERKRFLDNDENRGKPYAKIDCGALLRPALKLAPSTSHVYIQWAWCLGTQGDREAAQVYARKALEQEAGAIDVQVALGYLSGPEGTEIDLKWIHPSNRAYLGVPGAAGGASGGFSSEQENLSPDQAGLIRDLYEKTLRENPENDAVRSKYAGFLLRSGDLRGALQHYTQLRKKNPQDQNLKALTEDIQRTLAKEPGH